MSVVLNLDDSNTRSNNSRFKSCLLVPNNEGPFKNLKDTTCLELFSERLLLFGVLRDLIKALEN